MKTCCFIGHRIIEHTDELHGKIEKAVKRLIESGAEIFLFGSKSQFNDLALKIVTSLKEKYPFIKRVYVRAEYEFISREYEKYLLETYEETYFSPNARHAGNTWKLLIDKNLKKKDLIRMSGISNYTLNKLNAGKSVTTDTLVKICAALHCGIDDIMDVVEE